jgi:long-chain acyl-CoA synthetase
MQAHFRTLPELLTYVRKNFDSPNALNEKKQSSWSSISTEDFYAQVQKVSLGLKHLGIQKGDPVGIFLDPSPTWMCIDLAIAHLGAVSVPCFANVSKHNFEYQVQDSKMKALFVDTLEQREMANLVANSLEHVIQISGTCTMPKDIAFSSFFHLEKGASLEEQEEWLETAHGIQPEDPLTYIYTSGSTGVPKGVVLSHGNLCSQVHGAAQRFVLDNAKDKALSCLPLAHIFERMVTLFYLSEGVPVYFAEDVKQVGEDLRDIKPTAITLVPRLLEKVYAKMQLNVAEATGFKKFLGSVALERAISLSPLRRKNLLDTLLEKLVYSKMQQALGGKLRLAISGSAPLAPELCNFFLNIGIPIYEGYGCTETSPVIAANYPGYRKVGTVGLTFPEVQVRIAEDGELLVKGPNVMLEYLHKSTETSEVMSNGWYHTGDLGSVDAEGYVTITGRKKELFKTANGKYVAPTPIEAAWVRESSLVDMAMIIADNRPFVSVLLFPDFEGLHSHKEKMGCGHMNNEEFFESRQCVESLQSTLEKTNMPLNKWEQVCKFTVIPNPITIDSGELTPTMKVRRHIVEEKYQTQIETMYAS